MTTVRQDQFDAGLAHTASRLAVPALIRRSARLYPQRLALRDRSGRTVTYVQLVDSAVQIARWLDQRAGRGPVIVVARPSVDFYRLMYGALFAGAPILPLSPDAGAEEVAELAASAGASLVVVDNTAAQAPAIRELAGPTQRLQTVDLAELDRSAADQAPRGAREVAAEEIEPEAIATVFSSSGTTGKPKLIAISHRALVSRAALGTLVTRVVPDEVYLAWMPVFHVGGVDPVILAHATGQRVIVHSGFEPRQIVEDIADEAVGWLQLVPGTIRPLLDELARTGQRPRSVRVVGTMPDLVPAEDLAALTGELEAPYLNTYGATETGIAPGTWDSIAAGEAPTAFPKWQTYLCDLRIVDRRGHEVSVGETGEMLVRGPTMFSGYLGDAAATAAALADGWYHTGDLFRLGEDGSFTFVDRTSQMIKSGGENVLPFEVEKALVGIEGVTQATVVGIPSPQWGEMVAAVIVVDRDMSVDDIRERCRERLHRYKVPKRITFVSEAAYESMKNTTGKVARSAARALVEGEPMTPHSHAGAGSETSPSTGKEIR